MVTKKNLDPVTRGDTKTYSLTFAQSDGSRYDITGWTVRMTVKRDLTNSDADAKIAEDVTTHTNPTEGETAVKLDSTQTDLKAGTYEYDIQVETDTGDVYTLMRGHFSVQEQVTQR